MFKVLKLSGNGGATSMQTNDKTVMTADFDGITNWPVHDTETEKEEYYYSVDL